MFLSARALVLPLIANHTGGAHENYVNASPRNDVCGVNLGILNTTLQFVYSTENASTNGALSSNGSNKKGVKNLLKLIA